MFAETLLILDSLHLKNESVFKYLPGKHIVNTDVSCIGLTEILLRLVQNLLSCESAEQNYWDNTNDIKATENTETETTNKQETTELLSLLSKLESSLSMQLSLPQKLLSLQDSQAEIQERIVCRAYPNKKSKKANWQKMWP